MKLLLILLVAAAPHCIAGERSPLVQIPLVPPARILDATHFRRRNADEIEVIIWRNAEGGLLTFHLDRQPIAKLSEGEAIRLYLLPGHYGFGIVPTYNFPLTGFWEMKADVTRTMRQFYRVFQSSGFTSSGGNAVFEIARY